MNNLKPTAREVKVILASIGLKFPNYMFNDKRVNGGRIKLWGFQMSIGDMSRMRVMLQQLFPNLSEDLTVERYRTSTVVKWQNGEILPSQRHDW
jgi:hypothetical protein